MDAPDHHGKNTSLGLCRLPQI